MYRVFIFYQEADLGTGPFSVSAQRHEAVDFLTEAILEKQVILVNRPKPGSNLMGFIEAFS